MRQPHNQRLQLPSARVCAPGAAEGMITLRSRRARRLGNAAAAETQSLYGPNHYSSPEARLALAVYIPTHYLYS